MVMKKNFTMYAKLLLTPLLMILLGVVLMVRPDSGSALVGKIGGWALILLGGGLILDSLLIPSALTGKILFAAAALAAEYGIPYTDYNAAGAYERIGLDAAEDWRNENHLNRCGAEKFTQFIAFHLH